MPENLRAQIRENETQVDNRPNIDIRELPDTRPFMITVTYPGGLTDEHRRNFELFVRGPYAPGHWIFTIEDGHGDKHVHLHGILWYYTGRRTDAVTRTVRNQVFSPEDLTQVERHDRMVVTRTVVNLAGAFNYILKEHLDSAGIHEHLPPGIDVDALVKQAVDYWAQPEVADDPSDPLFPAAGKQRTVPPSKVPDFLARVIRTRKLPYGHTFAFGTLVALCWRSGIRFDLRSCRSYRVGMELILAEEEPSIHLINEIEWMSNK